MHTPSFFNRTHMATNLVKWWRSKFLNGYKQFSVVVASDCSDGRSSDTEDLLGRSSEKFTNSAPPRVPINPAQDTDPSSKKEETTEKRPSLNFEEFSCDVSLEGGLDKDGQERQEFSFTLYDFDGHGKITKDDIAGLVTTIYDTLGSSIRVPHYGSKTIKVRLTVSPDQSKQMSEKINDSEQELPTNKTKNNEVPPTEQKVRFKRDLNVTIREARSQRRTRRKHRNRDDHRSCCDVSVENNDGAADISDDADDDRCSRLSYEEEPTPPSKRYHSPRFKNHIRAENSARLTAVRQLKKQSSSLQRQELLEIIQANMEKNNLCFQTTRKHQLDHVNLENDITLAGNQTRRKHHKEHELPQSQCLSNTAGLSANNCPLDETLLQNNAKNTSFYHYDKTLGSGTCQPKRAGLHRVCMARSHYRSRSNDLTPGTLRYHLLDDDILNSDKHCYFDNNSVPRMNVHQHARSKSFETTFENCPLNYKAKIPQTVLGHTSSPHHMKHRNRQEDQARAMAQVVHWLEQEFSSNLKTSNPGLKKNKNNSNNHRQTPHQTPNASPKHEASSTEASTVERHEHHHVHEHIHHHYHHYQETPVVI